MRPKPFTKPIPSVLCSGSLLSAESRPCRCWSHRPFSVCASILSKVLSPVSSFSKLRDWHEAHWPGKLICASNYNWGLYRHKDGFCCNLIMFVNHTSKDNLLFVVDTDVVIKINCTLGHHVTLNVVQPVLGIISYDPGCGCILNRAQTGPKGHVLSPLWSTPSVISGHSC